MASYNSSEPQPLAHFPPISIFDPLDFNRSLPASQYTLLKTNDLQIMYKEISRVQAYLHSLINNGDTSQSLAIDGLEQAKPVGIEQIPPEILSMIFEHLVPPQNCNDLTPIQIPELADVLLPGQICRSWREVAIATPSLWSSLRFDLDPEKENMEAMVDMATACLARAKSNPLSITLGTRFPEQCRPIIAVLLAHSHHWCNLSSDPMASVSICQEPRVERDRLWMLRKLEVDCTHVREPRLFDTFQVASNLRIIDIADWGRPWHDIGQFPLLPWGQLQQVAFTGDVRDSLELLRLSPNLLVFKLTTNSDSDSFVGWNHVRHAFLRELAIDADNRGSSDFFGALTLPALVSLSYSGEEFPRDGITSMVNRSDISQSLDVFSLTLETIYEGVVPSIASKDIVEFLGCMPNLSQLSLHDQNKDRYTDKGRFHAGNISSICQYLTQRPVVRKLKRFAITGPPEMSCVMLAKMVRRRWRNFTYPRGGDIGPVRLESVEVNYPRPCVHAKSSLTRIPARSQSIACARALALLRQYQTEGLRVVGLPIDEVECIECIEKWRFGRESGFDFDR